MNETFELQGRSWPARQIQEIGQWVSQNPTWSRYRLSRDVFTPRLDTWRDRMLLQPGGAQDAIRIMRLHGEQASL